jgi:short-subunit dehydrogenase involved in D-alanine esterification of teichoic acids
VIIIRFVTSLQTVLSTSTVTCSAILYHDFRFSHTDTAYRLLLFKMPYKILDFKCALITGGAGGIGLAMAKYFLSQGKKVIIAGRTESKLQTASKELGDAPYYILDTSDTYSIEAFVHKLTTEHPEVDCLVNNAGVQRPLDVNKMNSEEFLSKADNELMTNIHGPMHLTLNLLPHLKAHTAGGTGAVIMNVSSVLGISPFSIINPVYNGSKAWMHFWTMNLRTQLSKDRTAVRVVEIVPPSVGTDLHRERENPDDNKKHKGADALTIDEFMAEVAEQLEQDKDVISAGMGKELVDRWYGAFGEEYGKAEAKIIKSR